MGARNLRTRALQVGLFVLLGLSILVILDTVSRAHPPRAWDGILLARMDTVKEDTGAIRTLVVGSSHAGGVDPDLFATRAIVFAFPWGDLAETAHQARVLAATLPELREVLIPISFFSFHWSNDTSDEDFLLDSRRTFHAVVGHGVPDGWRPVEGDLASLARGKSYWVARRDQLVSGRSRAPPTRGGSASCSSRRPSTDDTEASTMRRLPRVRRSVSFSDWWASRTWIGTTSPITLWGRTHVGSWIRIT